MVKGQLRVLNDQQRKAVLCWSVFPSSFKIEVAQKVRVDTCVSSLLCLHVSACRSG